MFDLKIDNNGDLELTDTGDVRITESIVQAVRIRLFRSEEHTSELQSLSC